jgi:Uncharacterised protein family UPF0547
MLETKQTKVCPLCAETIKVAAKVCPHCRYWQKKWSLQNPQTIQSIGAIVVVILITAVIMGLGTFFDHLVGPKRDFAPYQSQITVISSATSFRMVESNLMLSVIGIVTNQSEFGWKDLGMEAQLFDKDGKLIDLIPANGDYLGITVFPHSEAGFKIESKATKRESDYASHKVYVRVAKDIKAWP